MALAAISRKTTENVDGARSAAARAEDAALAALADPFDPPTARQVAQNFAAVAALVPTPQQLTNDAAVRSANSDRTVAATEAVARDLAANDLTADDLAARDSRSARDGTIGSRFSRFV